VLKLSAGEPATISHLKQTYEWNRQQQVDDFSWYSAEFDETIKFEGIADTISVADLYKAASILPRAKQNGKSIFTQLRNMGLLEEAESVSHDVLKNIKIRLLSLWGDVGQLEGTDRGTKLIKGEYYCWDGSNIPTVEQAKSVAGTAGGPRNRAAGQSLENLKPTKSCKACGKGPFPNASKTCPGCQESLKAPPIAAPASGELPKRVITTLNPHSSSFRTLQLAADGYVEKHGGSVLVLALGAINYPGVLGGKIIKHADKFSVLNYNLGSGSPEADELQQYFPGLKLVVYKHAIGGVAATMVASQSIMDFGVLASNREVKEQLLKHRGARTTAQAPAPSAGPSKPSYRQEAAAALSAVPADFGIEAKAVIGAMRELIGSRVPGMVDLPAVMEGKFEEEQLTTLYGVKIAMQDPEIYGKKMALTMEQVALVIECIKQVAVKGAVS